MPTIEIVRALRALQRLNPTSNPGRARLRDEAARRAEAELRDRARKAQEWIEALSRGERLKYTPDR